MSICQCYHDEQNFLHERGVCYGTKEKEPCSCGGNPIKCDFYEEVREKYIHRTNADRLRAMSVEELAEFLEMIPHCGNPPTYTMDGFCIDDGLRTKKQWLDWLKQEAEQNGERRQKEGE